MNSNRSAEGSSEGAGKFGEVSCLLIPPNEARAVQRKLGDATGTRDREGCASKGHEEVATKGKGRGPTAEPQLASASLGLGAAVNCGGYADSDVPRAPVGAVQDHGCSAPARRSAGPSAPGLGTVASVVSARASCSAFPGVTGEQNLPRI